MKLDLKYNNKALYRLEEDCGLKIHKLDVNELGFSDLVKLLWAGLLHKRPDLTIDEVLEEYDDILEDPEAYGDALNKAFEKAFPKAETEAKN